VRFFLAAHGIGDALRVVPQARFLDDLLAVFHPVLLALDFVLQRALDVAEGVHVFKLRPRAEFLLPAGPDGHVGVAAEGAFFHVAVADFEIYQDFMQAPEVFRRLFRRTDIRFADNFDERHAGAVQIHVAYRIIVVMDQLARVFLHVNPGDADLPGPLARLDHDVPVLRQRIGVLRNLVALGQVGIKVIFPCKDVLRIDGAVRRERHLHGVFHDFLVEHGQDARHSQTNGAGVAVGGRAEFGGTGTENFCFREQLGVDFQPDDGFKIHYKAGLLFSTAALFSYAEAICSSFPSSK